MKNITTIIKILEVSDTENSGAIHEILSNSFVYYKSQYTKEAYNATVISIEEIKHRINTKEYQVLLAWYADNIAGTASIKITEDKNLYICSMAVKPAYQGKSIGWSILQEVEQIAKQKKCNALLLQTFEPLASAIKLYKKFGFAATGKSRNYYGITIFEMKKKL
ncbi:MAG: GNAT family N-acetyltransferase [Chitinophagaceae bacterium]|nr:GNAT family N-acetyltransferase [Chitinophagaceae bacterium]